MDYSLSGSSIHRFLQARILEWIPISFSRGSSRPKDWTLVSCIAGRFFTVWATTEVLVLYCKLIKVEISSPRYSLSSSFAIELPLWDLIKKKNSSVLALKRWCQKVPGTDYMNLATFQLGSLPFAYLIFCEYDLSLFSCKCHSLLNDIEHLLHFISFLSFWMFGTVTASVSV